MIESLKTVSQCPYIHKDFCLQAEVIYFFKLSSHLFWLFLKWFYFLPFDNYLGFILTRGKDLYWSDNGSTLAVLNREGLTESKLIYWIIRRARVPKSQEQLRQAKQRKKKFPIISWEFSRALLLPTGDQRAEALQQQAQNNQYLCQGNKLLGQHLCQMLSMLAAREFGK